MCTGPRSSDSQFGSADDTLVLVEDAAPLPEERARPCWKVAVIDDVEAVHDGTRFALYDFVLDGQGLELLSAYSSEQGRALLRDHPDIAVVLLDVVMETETAGLELVEYIRRTLKNEAVRIILRTGQPGQAPERDVIVNYDINDYKSKTELTAAKLFTALTAALRGYTQLHRMINTRRGLEIIIDATAHLGELRSLHRLAEGILTQLASLLDIECAGILVLRDGVEPNSAFSVLAGSGCYRTMVGEGAATRLEGALLALIENAFQRRRTEFAEDRTVLYIGTDSGAEIVVILDSRKALSETDRALIGIFCNRLAASIDNLVLYEKVQEANRTLEQRVISRTVELAAANRRLEDQWSLARRGKALQSEIIGIVAHDLKNPLSVILGRAEVIDQLLAITPVDIERCLNHLGSIKDSTKRMAGMTDALVADVMADALDITLRREPNELGKLLHEVVEANRALADRKNQTIEISTDFEGRPYFDYDRMRDALDNLVSNAIKYSPPGETILVDLEQDGGHAVIRVIDNGPGLEQNDFSRLFGRFQRLSAKPTGGETSTGLGLSIVKRIADLHGGSIAASSAGPGRGTTFTLRLPIGDAATQ
jgi:signal transduction histidine kinase